MAGVGDVAFKVLSGGLGVATIYLTGVCAVNLFRGLSWHASQPPLIYAGLVLSFSVYCYYARKKTEKDSSQHGRQ